MSERASAPARRLSPRVKLLLLATIACAFVLGGLWRLSAGRHFSPGVVSLVTLVLSVALFVGLDLRAKFSAAGWIAVTVLVSFHQIATVHAPPFPGGIIYLGGRTLRIDHLVHLLAGVLVAWLVRHVVLNMRPRTRDWLTAVIVLAAVVTFGCLKEASDVLTERNLGHDIDWFDSSLDSVANVLGGCLLIGFLALRRGARLARQNSVVVGVR